MRAIRLWLAFVVALSSTIAQAVTEPAPAPPEPDILEIIQTPPPVEPEEITEPEPVDPTQVPAEIPAPELPQLLPTSDAPAAEVKPVEPPKPTGPKRLKFPAVDNVLLDPPLPPHRSGSIPASLGDTSGEVYIGHRSVVEKYNGWGWVKYESESWKEAKWVAIREKLGEVPLPGRHLKHPDNDKDMQYRLYGAFSGETAYEPNKDVFINIFDLKGFEVIGSASKPSGASMPAKAAGRTRSKPTTGGARSNPFNR